MVIEHEEFIPPQKLRNYNMRLSHLSPADICAQLTYALLKLHSAVENKAIHEVSADTKHLEVSRSEKTIITVLHVIKNN